MNLQVGNNTLFYSYLSKNCINRPKDRTRETKGKRLGEADLQQCHIFCDIVL